MQYSDAPSSLEAYGARSAAFQEHTEMKWRQSTDECSLVPLFGDLCSKVVLDVGAGAGRWTRRALQLGAKQVYAVEPSAQMAALAQAEEQKLKLEGVHHIQADIVEYDCSSLSADVAIVGYVLHHLARRELVLAALRNIYNGLKPGGRLAIAGVCTEEDRPLRRSYRNPPLTYVLPEGAVEWCRGHVHMEPDFKTDYIIQRRATIVDLMKETGFRNAQLAPTKCDVEALSGTDAGPFDEDALLNLAFFAAEK